MNKAYNAPIPPEIVESLAKFKREHPDPTKVGFLMMQFGSTQIHSKIVTTIRESFAEHGFTVLRADDKQYHDDLFPNILTYLHGCSFGIALFERLENEYFNPNVSLELGYMLGLRKKVCLLKDRTIIALPSDLAGRLYRSFDPQNSKKSIPQVLTSWMKDAGMLREKERKVAVRSVEEHHTMGSSKEEPNEWSFHELRVLKHHDERPAEFTLFKSTAGQQREVLQISFVFGMPGRYYNLQYEDSRWRRLTNEIMESGALDQHANGQWLRYTETANKWEGWFVDGTALKEEFPELEYLTWLDGEYHCVVEFPIFDRNDEPKESIRVAFQLFSEQDEGDDDSRARQGIDDQFSSGLEARQLQMLKFLFDNGSGKSIDAVLASAAFATREEGIYYLADLRQRGYVRRVKGRPKLNGKGGLPSTYYLTQEGRLMAMSTASTQIPNA